MQLKLDSLSKIIIIIIMNSIISIRMNNLNLKNKDDIRQKFLKGNSVNSARVKISALYLSHHFDGIYVIISDMNELYKNR